MFKGKHSCHLLLPTTVPLMVEPWRWWRLLAGRWAGQAPTAAALVLSCLWLTRTCVLATLTPSPLLSPRLLVLRNRRERKRKKKPQQPPGCARAGESVAVSRTFPFPPPALTCSSFVLAPSIVPLPSLSPSLSALLSPGNSKSLRVSRLIAGSRHCHSAATWT